MASDTDTDTDADGSAGGRQGPSPGPDLEFDLDADLTPGDGAAWALAGTLAGYGLILAGILVVLFLLPYALFALL